MNKICARCQKVWTKVPETARVMCEDDVFDGSYWECDCGTTLFVPAKKIVEAA